MFGEALMRYCPLWPDSVMDAFRNLMQIAVGKQDGWKRFFCNQMGVDVGAITAPFWNRSKQSRSAYNLA
jgi:hypothetical protein